MSVPPNTASEATSPSPAPFSFVVELRLPTAEERRAISDWMKQPGNTQLVFLLCVLLASWFATFWSTIVNLVDRWNTDDNYSHGFLVPIVSAYLALQNLRDRPIKERPKNGVIPGSILVLVGLGLGFITVLFPSLVAECFSMLVVLAGGVLLLGGTAWWKRLWVPILFLIFMAPWPSALYSQVAFPLQQLVCQYAAVGIELLGVPVLKEGNVLHLPKQSMHVAQACSGLRQLTAFLAICTCAMILMKRPIWYRMVLLVSAIPLAIIINVIRVVGTGMILQYGNPEWTQGTMHTLEGLLMVAMGMGLLWCEVKVLDWIIDDRPTTSAQRQTLAPAA